jgi:hypothetical protein
MHALVRHYGGSLLLLIMLCLLLLACRAAHSPTSAAEQVPTPTPLATTPAPIRVDASTAAGNDWGEKLNNAIGQCPWSTSCFVDATRLLPGVSSTTVYSLKCDLTVAFGLGTYEQAKGSWVSFGSHPSFDVCRRIEVYGQGSALTSLKFNHSAGDAPFAFVAAGSIVNGVYYPVVGAAPEIGAVSFTAQAADLRATSLKAGDIIVLGDRGVSPVDAYFDYIAGTEWHEIASVSGDTVTLTKPLERQYGQVGRFVWAKNHRVEDFSLHDLTLDNTAPSAGLVVLWVQYTRFAYVHDVLVKGTAACNNCAIIAFYQNEGPRFERNVVQPFGSASQSHLEYGGTYNGSLSNNQFICGSGRIGGVSYGSFHGTMANNVFQCEQEWSGGAAIRVNCSEDTVIENNSVRHDQGSATSGSMGIRMHGVSHVELKNNDVNNSDIGVHLQAFGSPPFVTSPWRPNFTYHPRNCVLLPSQEGWNFCTLLGGTSGNSEPQWNKAIQAFDYKSPGSDGATTQDGTVTWVGDKYPPTSDNIIDGLHVDDVNIGIKLEPGVKHTTIKSLSIGDNVGTPIQDDGGPEAISPGISAWLQYPEPVFSP